MSENTEPTAEISGELALQTLAMPRDTNANGDIFGGWLVSQMDLAAGIMSKQVTQGRSATVAIQNVNFLKPVSVGATVSCYCQVTQRGNTSVHIGVDVWVSHRLNHQDKIKVAEGLFVFVAIDEDGRPRPIPRA